MAALVAGTAALVPVHSAAAQELSAAAAAVLAEADAGLADALRGAAGPEPEPATTGAIPAEEGAQTLRLTPAPSRRRSAAARPVRAELRPRSPALRPLVQQPVAVLPDPVVTAELAVRKRLPEEDPYAPLGWRFGGLTVFPVIGQGIGWDSNPNRALGGKGSLLSQTEAEARVQSDWSRHEVTGFLRGAYNDYPQRSEANRPEGGGKITARIDVARDTQVDAEGRFAVDTQRPGSPELGVGVRDRPIVYSEGATLGVTQHFNRLAIGLRGTIDRTDYDDARLTNGSRLDQSDRNVTQYGARLRTAYELTPGIIPFAEGLFDTRVHDRLTDSGGYRRDSDGYGARAGSTFELSALLKGEVAAGYQVRSYEDARLRDLRGPLIDAALIWAFTPLTTIRLNGETRMDETTVAGASGIFASRATVEIRHDLRRNLSVTGSVTLADYDYRGAPIHERSFAASLRLDYRLTRQIALRASYTHEQLKSNLPFSDYDTDVFLVGLRLQP
jgi:hypothetical protein